MEKWVKSLPIAGAAADVNQLYPDYVPAGVAPNAAYAIGQQLRRSMEGTIITLSVESDGTNAGILELYDVAGLEIGADTSSLTAITDAQLTAALAAGTAKLLHEQRFAASGLTPWTAQGPARFMKGLAARVVGAAGTCKINLTTQYGYGLTDRG